MTNKILIVKHVLPVSRISLTRPLNSYISTQNDSIESFFCGANINNLLFSKVIQQNICEKSSTLLRCIINGDSFKTRFKNASVL